VRLFSLVAKTNLELHQVSFNAPSSFESGFESGSTEVEYGRAGIAGSWRYSLRTGSNARSMFHAQYATHNARCLETKSDRRARAVDAIDVSPNISSRMSLNLPSCWHRHRSFCTFQDYRISHIETLVHPRMKRGSASTRPLLFQR
jgi:hypothetical protein